MNYSQFSEDICPIAILGKSSLLIKKSDLNSIGKDLGILSVEVDVAKFEIFKAIDLEKHLKFNPWEEITDDKFKCR